MKNRNDDKKYILQLLQHFSQQNSVQMPEETNSISDAKDTKRVTIKSAQI